RNYFSDREHSSRACRRWNFHRCNIWRHRNPHGKFGFRNRTVWRQGRLYRTTANTDSGAIQQVMESMTGQLKITKEQAVANIDRYNFLKITKDQAVAHIASYNFLKTPASIADTAKLAAFLASDRARLMTGTVVNSSAGAALD